MNDIVSSKHKLGKIDVIELDEEVILIAEFKVDSSTSICLKFDIEFARLFSLMIRINFEFIIILQELFFMKINIIINEIRDLTQIAFLVSDVMN